ESSSEAPTKPEQERQATSGAADTPVKDVEKAEASEGSSEQGEELSQKEEGTSEASTKTVGDQAATQPVIEGANLETIEEEPQSVQSDAEQNSPSEAPEEQVEVPVAAPAVAAESVRTSAKSSAHDGEPQTQDPLKSYRVNASGTPLELKEPKNGSVIEQFKLDKELGIPGKSDVAAGVVDAKPGAAKQLNNIMMQMVAAQPTRSAEQVVKELATKLDVKGRENLSTPITALARASVERPLNAPNAVVSPLQAQIKAAIGQPQWQAAISERVAFMASQNIKSAEIQLDPPELGPLQVRVTVTQDQASVAFTSHHAQVREALDQTAFRLREMLHGEGMSQVDVDVSDQSEYQGQSQDSENAGGPFAQGSQEAADEEPQLTGVARVSSALVDQFV
ncbi:MAG: flagellar hook-length control protein FliK, partial [Pseudomonadota bacterium]|nr:flagellar hook-length control protein FliK [Pseudomonadota bacterium]